ncbi:efflux RND transporter permease subunit [Oceanispirochaeta sp.]|jgi:HAE1 family hydrophobic/amphiphilic exporter-1|uniref:efflux RND transporter permease subunit n=1 Tax=Oceanispirochaeta sp. TaxID=2035350 RepID=UPI002635893B|nr:efflux RND transporter permease subunit [Oceanispirochaeta sp.]MDA3959015.1 efflux RND transporter permease subunit [Oceanispirochaeta sp.]
MSITKTIVNRPTTVLIIFAILIGLGLYIVPQVPIDLYPEINPPILVVFTSYTGAGPEEIEQTVTRPLEGQMGNVSDVQRITSTSSEGLSMIILEFDWNTDLSAAAQDVRDKLEFIKDFLPDDAANPQIFKFDPAMMPIIDLVINGNRSPEEIRTIAEDQIQPYLEQVPGVATTFITGGREKVVRVEISQNRLEAYNLSLTQVAQMLSSQNMQIGAGSVEEGTKKYLVRTAGEYKSLEEISNAVISYKMSGGVTKEVRLRDIATVTEGYKDATNSVYINGEPGVYISIQKQSGVNSIETADNVIAKLKQINKNLPQDMSVSIINNTTEMIRGSLDQVTNSAITGAILAMAILFIFLRSIKSTLIIGLSIPIALLITIMFMYFAGLTLNLMTLAGLTLGVGMIVDSSIVILENIFRYREKGAKLKPSAILGSQEMFMAILASTLTTVCVFLPVIMFKKELEMIGVLFQDLAFTIIIALLSSLFIAITLVPVLASQYVTIYTRKQKPLKWKFLRGIDNVMEGFFTGMDNAYKRALASCLDNKLLTILVILGLFIVSIMMFPSIGMNFMPTSEEDSITLNLSMPVGTRLDLTQDYMNQLAIITEDEIDSARDIIISTGSGGFLAADNSSRGTLTITLKDYELRSETNDEIKEELRAHFDNFPSATFSFGSSMNMGGSASPIDIIIKTEDLDKARRVANEIKEMLKNDIPEVTEPEVSLIEGLPQAEIIVDREKAYSLGLSIYAIGNEISANVDGKTASRYRVGGDEFDILVILEEQDRSSIPDLEKIFIMNSMNQRIPLSSVARIEKTSGPVDIAREDQSRVVHVTGGLKPGFAASEVEPKVRQMIKENIVADETVIIDFNGDYAEIQSYVMKFIVIMIIAVALVFGVMASQFESLKDPFIIFFTIPLMAIGIIFIYKFTGEAISMYSAVGVIMLAGIVVNNGIVMVDYTNILRGRGLCIRDACIEAGGNRLRPVLMTTLTTVLGMLPMAFSKGQGSELVQPFGQTVVGGLTMSTILTLFLVPVLYALFNRKHQNNVSECSDSEDFINRPLLEETI